jgi:hypothetical protein
VRLAVTRRPRPDRPDRPDISDDERAWTSPTEDEEPEPDWAAEIRSGRKDRGARLREVYARFPDEPTPLDEPAPAEDLEDSRARPEGPQDGGGTP